MTARPGGVRSTVVFAGKDQTSAVLHWQNLEFRVPLGLLPPGLPIGEPLEVEVWRFYSAQA